MVGAKVAFFMVRTKVAFVWWVLSWIVGCIIYYCILVCSISFFWACVLFLILGVRFLFQMVSVLFAAKVSHFP